MPAAYTSAASLLEWQLLIWEEVTTAAIALAWGVFGLLLPRGCGKAARRPSATTGTIALYTRESFGRASLCRRSEFDPLKLVGSLRR